MNDEERHLNRIKQIGPLSLNSTKGEKQWFIFIISVIETRIHQGFTRSYRFNNQFSYIR